MFEMHILIDECKHGGLYRIDSRNLSLGVYDEKSKGFVGIRQKFDERYLFTEYHWDIGPPHGTVRPQKFLEMVPDDMPLFEYDKWLRDNDVLFKLLEEKWDQYKMG